MRTLGGLAGCFTLFALGCKPEAPPPVVEAEPEPRPSLVLVTLDTTRADRIGAYGYSLAATPMLDQLATEGVRFDRAYATVPLTTASHSTILTGLFPTRHGVHNNGDASLPDSMVTLAEVLSEAGYTTGAVTSAFVTSSIWNLDQGFDAYLDDVAASESDKRRWARERPANEVVDEAIGWLEQVDGPYFLWVHMFDAHAPYDPPEAFDETFEKRPYDGEIAFMDQELARLKPVVDAAAGDEGAAWIVVADHGEARSGEHGEKTHGLFLFDPTMRVPFIVRPPAPLAEPVVIRPAVSTADVMPTALGLLDIDVPKDLDGVDLSPTLAGERAPIRPVYLESEMVTERFGFHPEIAVAEGHHKLMGTPSPRLFDMAVDPREEKNLVPTDPDRVADLDAKLQAIRARAIDTEAMALSPSVAAQLEALGYVSSDAGGDATLSQVDAKDQVAVLEAMEEARGHAVSGSPVDAEAAYRKVLAQYPDISEARMGLARALQQQKRGPEAIEVYEAMLRDRPDSNVVRVNLANLLAMNERKDEAVVLFLATLEQVPEDESARSGLLRVLQDLGRNTEALEYGRAWVAANPDNPSLQASVGILLVRTSNYAEAAPMLQASLRDEVPRQFVHRMLARIASVGGDQATCEKELLLEVEAFPKGAEARMSLANLFMASKRWDEAAAEFAAVVELGPLDVTARRGQAQAIFNTGDYTRAAEILAPALEQHPDDPDSLLLHANLLSKLGKPDEAKVVFDQAKALRAAEVESKKKAAKAKAGEPKTATP
ncbi:MAG: sulfatase-like hydrolase/transferase [Proteobacteria bacterium]|nr:sulfatase-like hydrolase/transferase [Pseudomonadota bacterium]MCP4918757.1 sulfatase-like hydrolase/transferase [Pseudomonadota bacterium]